MGCGASGSEEEDSDESVAIAGGLTGLSKERRLCFRATSTDRREASRLRVRRPKDGCPSLGDRGPLDGDMFVIWVTVFVEAFLDSGTNYSSTDAISGVTSTSYLVLAAAPPCFLRYTR